MKALRIVGIILLVAVIAFGIGVAMQPLKGHVEQSIVINAPPSTVYKTVNTYKNFSAWAPWAKMDPGAKYAFEGPEEGVGAKMSWDGEKTGKGSQWIEESIPDQKVKCAMAFEGFDDTAYSEFILTPKGGGTTLTWTYDGVNKGITGKAMWMFMGTMLNDQYTQGLADLKTYVENLTDSASVSK
ncbi:MAG TPA: SRPBCC family protein [Cyclobacteriaceae bacterium]|nr:SRPBCC family protein [Cyclobacteriaceae bacterium]